MESVAIFLMILGVASQACHQLLQSFVLRHKVADKNTLLVYQNFVSALMLGAIAAWYSLEVTNAKVFWIAIAITTFANIFIQYANVRARELADLSLTAPISAMTPGLVTIAAFSLGEIPSAQGWAGIALIALGTYIHGRAGASDLRDYLKPLAMFKLPSNFKALDRSEREQVFKDVSAIRWAYVSAMFATLGLIGDGLVARNGSVMFGFGLQTLLLGSIFAASNGRKLSGGVKGSLPKPMVILTGICYGLQIIFLMTAFRFSPVGFIGSLKRLSIVLV